MRQGIRSFVDMEARDDREIDESSSVGDYEGEDEMTMEHDDAPQQRERRIQNRPSARSLVGQEVLIESILSRLQANVDRDSELEKPIIVGHLYSVKCSKGEEEDLVFRLLRKAIDENCLAVRCLLFVPRTPGYLYFEADRECALRELIGTGFKDIKRHTIELVDKIESTKLMSRPKDPPSTAKGKTLIEIQIGPYKGALVESIGVPNSEGIFEMHVVPRINFEAARKKDKGRGDHAGVRHFREAGCYSARDLKLVFGLKSVKEHENGFDFGGNKFTHSGLQILELSAKGVIGYHLLGDRASMHLPKESKKRGDGIVVFEIPKFIAAGDLVIVTRGEFGDCRAIVQAITASQDVHLQFDFMPSASVILPVSMLVRSFHQGDVVCVRIGVYRGLIGIVFAKVYQRLYLATGSDDIWVIVPSAFCDTVRGDSQVSTAWEGPSNYLADNKKFMRWCLDSAAIPHHVKLQMEASSASAAITRLMLEGEDARDELNCLHSLAAVVEGPMKGSIGRMMTLNDVSASLTFDADSVMGDGRRREIRREALVTDIGINMATTELDMEFMLDVNFAPQEFFNPCGSMDQTHRCRTPPVEHPEPDAMECDAWRPSAPEPTSIRSPTSQRRGAGCSWLLDPTVVELRKKYVFKLKIAKHSKQSLLNRTCCTVLISGDDVCVGGDEIEVNLKVTDEFAKPERLSVSVQSLALVPAKVGSSFWIVVNGEHFGSLVSLQRHKKDGWVRAHKVDKNGRRVGATYALSSNHLCEIDAKGSRM